MRGQRATSVLAYVLAGCSSGAIGQPGLPSGPPSTFDDGDGGSNTGDATSGVATWDAMEGGSTASGGDSSSGGADSSSGGPDGPQTFDDDPGWVSFNLPFGGNDYGWRPTANAGGDPGEIGGFFQAPTELSYYADLGIVADDDAMIVAAGTLDIVAVDGNYNYNTFFGYFSSADPLTGRIGIAVLEPNSGEAARVRIVYGTGSAETFTVGELGIDRDWTIEYDPNEAGFGGVKLTLEGQGVESVDLTAEDRASIGNLDSFGFVTAPSDNAGVDTGLLEIYTDDLDYTH